MGRAALILCCTLMLGLSACVGGGTIGSELVTEDPSNVDLGERGVLVARTSSVPISRDRLLHLWGHPDRVSLSANAETWTYDAGAKKTGLLVVLGIPIPLQVRTGRHQTILTFRGPVLVAATMEQDQVRGGLCGMFLIDDPAKLEFACIRL